MRRGPDDARVVVDDVERDAGREALAHFVEALEHGVDDGDGVLSGLLLDLEDDRGLVVVLSRALFLLRAVFDATEILDANRAPRLLLDDDAADLLDTGNAAGDAERDVLRAGLDAAARHVEVLRGECALHIDGGHLV